MSRNEQTHEKQEPTDWASVRLRFVLLAGLSYDGRSGKWAPSWKRVKAKSEIGISRTKGWPRSIRWNLERIRRELTFYFTLTQTRESQCAWNATRWLWVASYRARVSAPAHPARGGVASESGFARAQRAAPSRWSAQGQLNGRGREGGGGREGERDARMHLDCDSQLRPRAPEAKWICMLIERNGSCISRSDAGRSRRVASAKPVARGLMGTCERVKAGTRGVELAHMCVVCILHRPRLCTESKQKRASAIGRMSKGEAGEMNGSAAAVSRMQLVQLQKRAL